jgi:hypothetical protein
MFPTTEARRTIHGGPGLLPHRDPGGVARAPGAGVADQRSQGWRSAVLSPSLITQTASARRTIHGGPGLLPHRDPGGVARAPGAGVADQRSHGWRSAVRIERAQARRAAANVRRRGTGNPDPRTTCRPGAGPCLFSVTNQKTG